MDAADGHSLLLPFDTDEGEFARGFEAGRIWGMLRAHPDDEFEEYVGARNAEMVLRIADATNRTARSEELDEGWLLVSFSRSDGEFDPGQ